MPAPVAKKIPHTLTIHGDIRTDDYFWLNNRENPDVIDYLNAENAYTDEVMKPTEKFRKQLYDEMVGRIKQTDESVPYRKKGYWFYNRFEEKKEYPVFCRKKGSLEAEEEILLNVNEIAEGKAYCQAGAITLNPGQNAFIYGVDFVSRRQFDLYYKNLETGEITDLKIGNTTGAVAWSACGKYFFYTAKNPETLRTDRIVRVELATLQQTEVYAENDDTFYVYIGKSKSEKYLIISSNSTLTSEMQYLEADNPLGNFTMFQPRIRGVEYSAAHFKNKWYVHTNYKATNFRLMECTESGTGIDNWKEVIAHRADTLLEGLELFENYMVLDERRDGLTHLRIINQQTAEEHYLDFGEDTYTAWSGTNPEYETTVLRFGYTSLTTPSSVFDYDMESRQKTLMKQQEVVGGYNASDYHAERLWVASHDGVKVPVSLVYKKSLKKADGNPLLLYGYGSYGHSIDPYFSSTRLSLLDRGFIFAIAHIRGGEEMGRQWYENGRQLQKKNTFYDFIAAGELLLSNGYAAPNKLYAMGGSAGGLLMGAVINMKPGLWKGVVAQVPFVDVVTTMLDDSIPLTTGEYDEWGNPNDQVYYAYIKSYSPYDNVQTADYPNLLVTTGLHDSQVQYWEPAKWVAKLRQHQQGKGLILLHTNMDAGHGGASGRFEMYKEVALEYAFLLYLEGITA